MPQVNDNGDLFDVFSREEVSLLAPQAGVLKQVNNKKLRDVEFSNALIPLGFAMEIPKGFKANLYPRSSTYKKWGIIFGNHVGQVDSSFRGNNDEWLVSAIALKATEIHAADKIAQFEIVDAMEMPTFKKVEDLGNYNRGGFGSTGEK